MAIGGRGIKRQLKELLSATLAIRRKVEDFLEQLKETANGDALVLGHLLYQFAPLTYHGTSTTKFEDLEDDLWIKIFEYLRVDELFRLGKLGDRFQSVANRTLAEYHRYEVPSEYSYSNGQHLLYLAILRQCPRLRTISLELLFAGLLQMSVLAGLNVQQVIDDLLIACPNPNRINFESGYRSSGFLPLAQKLTETICAQQNQIKIIEFTNFQSPVYNISAQAENLIQIVTNCPLFENLILHLDCVESFETRPDRAQVYSQARDVTDRLWTLIGQRTVQLEISHMTELMDPWFGTNLHWTYFSFDRLTHLKISAILTPLYLRNVAQNCLKLESLKVEAHDFDCMLEFAQLKFLTKLRLRYFQFESDNQRDINRSIFDEFLLARGRKFEYLALYIPYQHPKFFRKISDICSKSMTLKLELSGGTKRPIELENLYQFKLRTLILEQKSTFEQIDAILVKGSKLRKMSFYIPVYEKGRIPQLEKSFEQFASKFPNRRIEVSIFYCGSAYYPLLDETRKGNLFLRIDNGGNLNSLDSPVNGAPNDWG